MFSFLFLGIYFLLTSCQTSGGEDNVLPFCGLIICGLCALGVFLFPLHFTQCHVFSGWRNGPPTTFCPPGERVIFLTVTNKQGDPAPKKIGKYEVTNCDKHGRVTVSQK